MPEQTHSPTPSPENGRSPAQTVQENAANRMTTPEKRSTFGLSMIFMLRMLGLFLLLPIFMLEAAHYEGGDDSAMLGLAFGIYGLAQAVLQIPFGMASDRFGRKRIIAIGLLLFIVGSLLAALSDSVWGLLIGRAVQGAGAVSAAVTALLADQTREVVRTKAMAVVGIGIGVSFALSLVAAPILAASIGLSGVFFFMVGLGILGLVALFFWVPKEEAVQNVAHQCVSKQGRGGNPFLAVLQDPALLRLNFGVFVLHAVQTAMWLVVPALLVRAGLAGAQHWQVYLPALLVSLLLVGGFLFRLERAGRVRLVFLLSIACVLWAQLGFMAMQARVASTMDEAALWLHVPLLTVLLTVFFVGFNALEASQPSMVSKVAPKPLRGAALGVYNTTQALGLFVGGAWGGWMQQHFGSIQVLAFNALLLMLWWVWMLKIQSAD